MAPGFLGSGHEHCASIVGDHLYRSFRSHCNALARPRARSRCSSASCRHGTRRCGAAGTRRKACAGHLARLGRAFEGILSSSAATQSMIGAAPPRTWKLRETVSPRFIRRFFARCRSFGWVPVKSPRAGDQDDALARSERDEEPGAFAGYCHHRRAPSVAGWTICPSFTAEYHFRARPSTGRGGRVAFVRSLLCSQ